MIYQPLPFNHNEEYWSYMIYDIGKFLAGSQIDYVKLVSLILDSISYNNIKDDIEHLYSKQTTKP